MFYCKIFAICLIQISSNIKIHFELPRQIKMYLYYKWGLFDLKCWQSINYINIVCKYVAANTVKPSFTKMLVTQLKNPESMFELRELCII